MKKYVTLLLLVLFCSSALCVEVSAGSIEIIGKTEEKIEAVCNKVAEWKQGELVLTEPYRDCNVDLSALISNEDTRQAIEVLQKRKRGVNQSYSIEGLNGKFEDLEEGVYLLEGMSQEEHEMQSVLVSIPAIDDKTGELIYDIEVTPKMISMYSVDTGDDNSVVVIGVICMISLLFVIRTLYFSLRLC